MLWQPKRWTAAQLEERRLAAVRLLRAGKLSQAEVARRLGVSEAAVTSWKRRWEAEDLRGLRHYSSPGRPSRLTEAQWRQLLRGLRRGAVAAGFDTERWTQRRIAVVIERTFGVRYHFRSVGRALRARGWSPPTTDPAGQRARRRAGRGVAAAGLAPHKKGARRTGRAVAFLDETGHAFRARVGTTWAPVGRPPLLRRVSQRREVSSIAALVAPLDEPHGTGAGAHLARPQLYARHFHGSIHGEQVIVALRYFRRRIGRPLVVIWDRLNAHRAKLVLAFVAAHPDDYAIEWLPPYAPELNPEELCNGAVKRAMLNAVPASVDELHQAARRSFIRLGRQPRTLRSFFRHVGLTLN